jgi:transcriptional repressor NrdR
MRCPYCAHEDVRVLDSRPGSDGQSIRRRRECVQCGKRWKTIERIDAELPLVMKRNHTYEPFDREKLRSSIAVSCGKRPVTLSQIDELIATIEWKILQVGSDSVSSKEIGEMVMEALKGIDEIAYIRFASVYKRFKDAGEMLSGMKDLFQESKKPDDHVSV